MSKVKVELNHSGIRDLLRSPEAREACEKQANKALGKLGAGYVVTSYTGSGRANASIFAESNMAKKENLENNTILKALR